MAHIGLLEDNIRIARLCATMLQYAGYEVTVYDHPRACLSALLLQSLSPEKDEYEHATSQSDPTGLPVDVLILDLNLPDINGLEVVHALCSHPRTHSLPLIFCTAASSSEVVQALRVAPSASFIGKPFTFQELTGAVKQALTPSHT
ncbi:MAG TPA: response regulator [Ktedonobacteraceae bacterium]|jgi:CheY-like chemotaxis protein